MNALEHAYALAMKVHAGEILDDRPDLLRNMTAAAPTTDVYNHFLFQLAKRMTPDLIVETGTDRGRSAAHFALGDGAARVVSIDIDPACSEQLTGLGLPNVEAWTGDSLSFASRFEDRSIQILFLDSLHTYPQLSAELRAFTPKVCSGGLIILDDITISPEMERCWNEITLRKVAVPLHFSGFGLVEV